MTQKKFDKKVCMCIMEVMWPSLCVPVWMHAVSNARTLKAGLLMKIVIRRRRKARRLKHATPVAPLEAKKPSLTARQKTLLKKSVPIVLCPTDREGREYWLEHGTLPPKTVAKPRELPAWEVELMNSNLAAYREMLRQRGS